jgi:hypothetical protein
VVNEKIRTEADYFEQTQRACATEVPARARLVGSGVIEAGPAKPPLNPRFADYWKITGRCAGLHNLHFYVSHLREVV